MLPEHRSVEATVLLTIERINRIIFAAPTLEEMLAAILDAMLDEFRCERAWLLFPCDPSAKTFTVPMERTRPGWAISDRSPEQLPVTPLIARAMAHALADRSALRVDGVGGHDPVDDSVRERFSVQSVLAVALRPREGAPWLLGIHHCLSSHIYSDSDAALMEVIGARVADGLTGVLAYRASQRDRQRLEAAQALAKVGSYEWEAGAGAHCSAEFVRLAALTLGDMPQEPRDLLELVHSDDRERVLGLADRYRFHPGAFEFEVKALRHGQAWFALVRGEVRHDEPGRIGGVSLAVQDITSQVLAREQQAKLEAELAQAQKLQSLGRLTGGVAHDFNNLLTVMLGNVCEAVEVLGPDHRATDLLADVEAAVRRAADLTRMLTAFARQQHLRPQLVDLNSLVERQTALLRRVLGDSIGLRWTLTEALWRCKVDPSQMESALLNLALNARDAMPSGGILCIETRNVQIDPASPQEPEVSPGAYVELSVSDSGVGMSPEELRRAFEPFFTTKGPGRGTGLGLSMVYGFVRQSGGHVLLESQISGGTRAMLRVPRVEPEPEQELSKATRVSSALQARPDPAASDAPGHGEHVLVVEDQVAVRSLTLRHLEHLGYVGLAAADVGGALWLLAQEPRIALVLTDLTLACGETGMDVARGVRAARPALPVLFMSGHSELFSQKSGTGAFTPLLEKPFTRAQLSRRLRELLDPAGAQATDLAERTGLAQGD